MDEREGSLVTFFLLACLSRLAVDHASPTNAEHNCRRSDCRCPIDSLRKIKGLGKMHFSIMISAVLPQARAGKEGVKIL